MFKKVEFLAEASFYELHHDNPTTGSVQYVEWIGSVSVDNGVNQG
ncbi:hypothetical protein C5167_045095 [Papaver somniferum]|uniref:Uncharacterized protein n=1 Tax=Papaver somniferum TaxID=3469 RepID=A0A4Y7LCD1_PAPSO|nr:hypothetical protein C5167_045095 [Papaver somniferum]